jgi:hypothetical protein
MIVRIEHFEPQARFTGHCPVAQLFAERFSLYQDRHSGLMSALWDDAVTSDVFTRLNEDLRRLAFELKKLRLELADK